MEQAVSGGDPEPSPAPVGASKREALIARAEELASQGDYDHAIATIKQLLLVDPRDCEAIFIVATMVADSGNLSDAITWLDSIPQDHPEAGLAALGQSADWCVQVRRYDEAERRYNEVLKVAPDAYPARRQLAFLLNCQGRREEAAEQIRELCKLGNARQDELHSLVVLSHAMYDAPDSIAREQQADTTGVSYQPIGQGGIARKLFSDGKFAEAAESIEDLIASGEAPDALVALFGRVVTEAQDDEKFNWWLQYTSEETAKFADHWAALGTYLISERKFDQATHALLQAMDRDPTDLNSAGRLVQTFSTLGDEAASQRWVQRWSEINESLKANNRVAETEDPDPLEIIALADTLKDLGRSLEALLWTSVASHYRGTLASEIGELNSRRLKLLETDSAFPSREQRLLGYDPADYPAPSFDRNSTADSIRRRPRNVTALVIPPRFQDIGKRIGLDHAYQVASKPQPFGFSIYQTLGGAAVAVDYDLDGWVDLNLTQGGSDPPTFTGTLSDKLYRHVDARLIDVTRMADAEEYQFSTGGTAGDWNQDGFPDLVVSNIGQDLLMINNGDGTFARRVLSESTDRDRLPASTALADLTGDHLPDIFQVNYIRDPGLTKRPEFNERGEVVAEVLPFQFRPSADQIYLNDPLGNVRLSSPSIDPLDSRLGLGLVVTDFDRKPGNEVFVGNDVYPDQLWVRGPSSDVWTDVAPVVGCAFGVRGSKTASMGIAAGDLDGTGTIDLHVTNFQDRNSSLFINLGEAFLERNVEYGMAEASQSVLGWGTQAIDYDNDSRLDLAVTNGHVEKATTIHAPFEQPAQLFANRGNRFDVLEVDDPSGYWSNRHLGRGLARLDFNRDGRVDFVITHLGEPTALILNETPLTHHWLQLRLVGTESERDAVGAKIEVDFAGQTATDWVTAGDGYLSKNESIVFFGLADVAKVDEVRVHWPSGLQQSFRDVASGQRILIVEGQSEIFRLP